MDGSFSFTFIIMIINSSKILICACDMNCKFAILDIAENCNQILLMQLQLRSQRHKKLSVATLNNSRVFSMK